MSPETQPLAAPELVVERISDAPPERIWRLWSDPEQLKRWWGPKTFTSPVYRMDFRTGGRYLFCMRDPGGTDYWGTGVYREIVPFERIVFTDSFSDADGNPVPAEHYGLPPGLPDEYLVTVTLEDLGGRTRLTLRYTGMPAGQFSELTGQGWNESFDKMVELLVV